MQFLRSTRYFERNILEITFQRRKINRKPEIENRKSMKGGRRTSLGQNPPGTIARYKCNIQLIVYHGATIAVVGRLRAWPKPPFVGQRWYYDRVRWSGPTHRFHVGTHRCRRSATPSSSTHLVGPRILSPTTPPTQQISRTF